MLAAPEICAEVQKARLPYSVSFFSETAAIVALEEIELLKASVREILAERDHLWTALQEISSLRIYPSDANFFLVRCANSTALFQHLLQDGLLVRDVSGYPGLENCLRISIGRPEENEKLLESLKKWK